MRKLSKGKTEKYAYYQEYLQSRCEQQLELLQRLQRDHAIVTDPAVKFEREHQVERIKNELEQDKLDLILLETVLTSGDDSKVPDQYRRKPNAENPSRRNLLTPKSCNDVTKTSGSGNIFKRLIVKLTF